MNCQLHNSMNVLKVPKLYILVANFKQNLCIYSKVFKINVVIMTITGHVL